MYHNLYIDPIINLLKIDCLAKLTFLSIIVRLLLSIICGGILGIQRSKSKHPAGLRTFILVSLGASVAGLTSQFIIELFGSGDGARLGAQVISGIGFLCAGTILITSKNQIKGLTTAAGLWASGCIGLTIGLGFYTLALVATILVFSIFTILIPIEEKMKRSSNVFSIHVELETRPNLKELLAILRENNIKVVNVEHNLAYASSGLSVYTLMLESNNKNITQEKLKDIVSNLSYVNYIELI